MLAITIFIYKIAEHKSNAPTGHQGIEGYFFLPTLSPSGALNDVPWQHYVRQQCDRKFRLEGGQQTQLHSYLQGFMPVV